MTRTGLCLRLWLRKNSFWIDWLKTLRDAGIILVTGYLLVYYAITIIKWI